MESEDRELIKALTPFNDIPDADFDEILKCAKLTPVSQGKLIFKRSDEDTKIYWLAFGSVDLLDEKFEAKNRKADEDVTRNAIDNNSPHRLTAVSTEESKILIIDVRNPKKVEEKKISGSLNITLLLRKNLCKLKPEGVYVMACDGGKRAELGAYILNENSFSAYVLNQVSES